MVVATNFVSDVSDMSKSLSENDTFSGKIEGREDDGIIIFWTDFLVPSGFRLFEELLVSSLFEYSFSVLISDSEILTFIRALITRFLLYNGESILCLRTFKILCWLHDEWRIS